METLLKTRIDEALRNLSVNMTALRKITFESGGEDALSQWDAAYDQLRTKYFELLQQELNSLTPIYISLLEDSLKIQEQLISTLQKQENERDILIIVNQLIEIIQKLSI